MHKLSCITYAKKARLVCWDFVLLVFLLSITATKLSNAADLSPKVTLQIIDPPVKVDPVIALPIIDPPVKVDPVITLPIIDPPVKVDPVITLPIIDPPVKVDPVIALPIIKPVIQDPVTPTVINPQLLPVNIKAVEIPKNFNPDLASVVVEKDFAPYLTLNPEILDIAVPVFYNQGLKYYEFEQEDQEGWFVFYLDGTQAVDINITSALELQYDVLNQEGTSVELNELGGLDSGMVAGFYYIRVINTGGLGFNNSFGIETMVFISQGGIVHGVVTDQCDSKPVAGASVSIATDFRVTYTDGSYEFLPKNPAEHTMTALAKGYTSQEIVATVVDLISAKADFQLVPIDGCDKPEAPQELGEPEVRAESLRLPVIYNDLTGVIDFVDVYAIGLPDGDKHFRAQLTKIAGSDSFLFEVSALAEISTVNQNISATYNFADSSLTVPAIQAFGKIFSVELSHDPDLIFSVDKVTELN